MRCVIPNCSSSFVGRAKRNSEAGQKQLSVGFFSFPKCPETFKSWVKFCGPENVGRFKTPYICIQHFRPEDIEGSLKFEMGLAKKRTLRSGAVPCINKCNESETEKAKKLRIQRRENKRLVAELLAENEGKSGTPDKVIAAPIPAEISLEETVLAPPPDACEAASDSPVLNADPLIHIKLNPINKCRICYQDFYIDSAAKDLFDEANSILLFHVEVISGVWISPRDGEPHLMCPACQFSLNTAIQFREMCINTELRLTQGHPVCTIEDVVEECLPSNPECVQDTELSPIEEAPDDPEEEEEVEEEEIVADEEPAEAEPLEELNPAASDPLSVALGAKIFKELINQYTGQERVKRPKQEDSPDKKPKVKTRKLAVRGAKPKKRPKTKEERNMIRRAQLRARAPNFVCDQCGQAFRMSHNLRMHQLRHSRTKNYACTECPMTFYDAYMRNIHIRIRHRGETPFACRYCSEAFGYAGARQKHESKVHGAPPRLIVQRINPKPKATRYNCKMCNKSYASNYALRWHVKSHLDNTTYKCQQCEKSYNDPVKLKRHEMTHEKRPLQCEVCLKGFYQRTRLKEHELIHTGERPYWCEVCDVHFRYKYNVKTHENTRTHKDNLLKREASQESVNE
ncbi:hypothetical protein KR018_012314 [Drosophila ironensis]|nr:hypothetical protein KR018_012314 [Drosophila ironensis]